MLNDFTEFIRKHDVVSLAIGFMMGGAVQKFIGAIISDVINPLLGIILSIGDLSKASTEIGPIKFMWGDLISNSINFIAIIFVVYFGIKILKLDKLRKPL
ncbi:MAG: hypothetical protein A2528_01610 [Candidatus Staskawiczbacteria bacterium RIFOXYD2_FULL_37_9]|uniref:Mechanosensitive ion channel protein MscL n=1 Tax=Candidatus Staskawiczbacteria bacterium RIFOXYB1_FULL_37_44 TaxID=1802223 RepID=A0A1G2IWE9_9BACT|nr:MAG: hypothetical protein A2358_03050 [Candidatus Staskawiczbacteria bacterium RIFOXYB1_FULL_37_44]OGZ83585.1 MAG: hypothetical protein A2416_04515 [Candidatus Staskawiczbacteria bacterium RIFOXYC1_FULL_37_52]OGZ88684.1 MAG: hypothetical protein A2581_02770 [Candidatus Staskawiczbacteria bacterium RIFOXYD1_FULL_37_110]OGZ89025.1 MAG: hypothetical protein A2444_00110 [Candidatus Staskawiczbacteria bacterium RIFOXYC2_FULL_37_19]OGZ92997.1 MAG: hypothetical protein A2528_01610 [Candidatus Stask